MNGEAVIKTNEIWKLFMKKMAIAFQAEYNLGFPVSSDSKESACNAGDLGLIPELGRSLGEGNGNPLQYSFLENSMDRGAWWATVQGVSQIQHE